MQDDRPMRVIRPRETAQRVNLSLATLYRRAKDGTFPRPIRLGGNSSGWIENEVDGWIAARVAERDAGAGGEK